MTIKDVADRIGISHQAVRNKLTRIGGKPSGEYTVSGGDLTPEGLQLIADAYFDGDMEALLHPPAPEPSCDDARLAALTEQNNQLTEENNRLNNLNNQLTTRNNELSNLNNLLTTQVASLTSQVDRITATLTDQAQSITRLADQAQQLQLESIRQQKSSNWFRRLLGK